MTLQTTTTILQCTTGRSYKEYRIHLDRHPNGLSDVRVQYGRIGNLLHASYRRQQVDYSTACDVVAKLIKEKLAKGYHLTGSQSPQAEPPPLEQAPAPRVRQRKFVGTAEQAVTASIASAMPCRKRAFRVAL
ncbi:MAG: hypothetical protein ACYC9P_06775 [Rudaea sp.]